MPLAIPFLPSQTNYVLTCPLGDETVIFDVRWNSRDKAFYVDIYDTNDDPILYNVKIVCGISLGRRSTHPFFQRWNMTALDTSGQGKDPGFDDLGGRVVVTLSGPLT